ncbi:hypothetical protein [Blastococcus sp. SYSU DS0533]
MSSITYDHLARSRRQELIRDTQREQLARSRQPPRRWGRRPHRART